MNSHSPHSTAYDDVKRLYEAMDNVLRCLSQHIAQDSVVYLLTWMKRIREVLHQPSHLFDHRDELIRIMIREKFCRKALMAINVLLQNSYITEEVLKCIMVLLSSPLSQRAAFSQLYDANLLVFATLAIRNYFWSYSIRQLATELIYLSVSLALKLRSDASSAERNESWEKIESCDAEYHSMLLQADVILDSCASQLMESEFLHILPDLISNFSQSTDVRGIYNSIYCLIFLLDVTPKSGEDSLLPHFVSIGKNRDFIRSVVRLLTSMEVAVRISAVMLLMGFISLSCQAVIECMTEEHRWDDFSSILAQHVEAISSQVPENWLQVSLESLMIIEAANARRHSHTDQAEDVSGSPTPLGSANHYGTTQAHGAMNGAARVFPESPTSRLHQKIQEARQQGASRHLDSTRSQTGTGGSRNSRGAPLAGDTIPNPAFVSSIPVSSTTIDPYPPGPDVLDYASPPTELLRPDSTREPLVAAPILSFEGSGGSPRVRPVSPKATIMHRSPFFDAAAASTLVVAGGKTVIAASTAAGETITGATSMTINSPKTPTGKAADRAPWLQSRAASQNTMTTAFSQRTGTSPNGQPDSPFTGVEAPLKKHGLGYRYADFAQAQLEMLEAKRGYPIAQEDGYRLFKSPSKTARLDPGMLDCLRQTCNYMLKINRSSRNIPERHHPHPVPGPLTPSERRSPDRHRPHKMSVFRPISASSRRSGSRSPSQSPSRSPSRSPSLSPSHSPSRSPSISVSSASPRKTAITPRITGISVTNGVSDTGTKDTPTKLALTELSLSVSGGGTAILTKHNTMANMGRPGTANTSRPCTGYTTQTNRTYSSGSRAIFPDMPWSRKTLKPPTSADKSYWHRLDSLHLEQVYVSNNFKRRVRRNSHSAKYLVRRQENHQRPTYMSSTSASVAGSFTPSRDAKSAKGEGLPVHAPGPIHTSRSSAPYRALLARAKSTSALLNRSGTSSASQASSRFVTPRSGSKDLRTHSKLVRSQSAQVFTPGSPASPTRNWNLNRALSGLTIEPGDFDDSFKTEMQADDNAGIYEDFDERQHYLDDFEYNSADTNGDQGHTHTLSEDPRIAELSAILEEPSTVAYDHCEAIEPPTSAQGKQQSHDAQASSQVRSLPSSASLKKQLKKLPIESGRYAAETLFRPEIEGDDGFDVAIAVAEGGGIDDEHTLKLSAFEKPIVDFPTSEISDTRFGSGGHSPSKNTRLPAPRTPTSSTRTGIMDPRDPQKLRSIPAKGSPTAKLPSRSPLMRSGSSSGTGTGSGVQFSPSAEGVRGTVSSARNRDTGATTRPKSPIEKLSFAERLQVMILQVQDNVDRDIDGDATIAADPEDLDVRNTGSIENA